MAAHLPPSGWAQVQAQAQAASQDVGNQLTSLRAGVLRTLWEAQVPLGAYELTDRLNRSEPKRLAPNSVYRALDFLEKIGLVCKVASRQAYALVPQPGPCHPILLTCSGCGTYSICESSPIHDQLRRLAEKQGFAPNRHIVELDGECDACRANKMT